MLLYTEFLLFVLAFGGPTVESLSEETCRQYAEDGNCDFYTECLEDRYSCGDKGYLVGYGHRYCTRFNTYYDEFNDKGKAWIDEARKCLLKALLPFYKSQSYSCDELKTFAFASHPTCYTDSGEGFCKVVWTNMDGLWNVFQLKDFYGEDSVLAVEQIQITYQQCLCLDTLLAEETSFPQMLYLRDFTDLVLDVTAALLPMDPEDGVTEECVAKALRGDCNFYKDCLEQRYPCGREGFALQEGRVMCERLKEKKGLFNAQGQLWVTDFTKCMARSLLPKYKAFSASCRHIHNFGYRAQYSCFIDTGICELMEENRNEFALWYVLNAIEDERFQLELSTILCRCDRYEGGSRYTLKWSSAYGTYFKQKAAVVDQSSQADIPCTRQGGKCQDYTVRTCLAGYETGKCGGNSLRRCCLPCDSSCQTSHQTWSARDSRCSNAGGQCKMDSNFCYGQYKAGLCGGPAERRCCVIEVSDSSEDGSESQSPCDMLSMKSRDDWGAQPPRNRTALAHPTQKVVIHHTDSNRRDWMNTFLFRYSDEEEYIDRLQGIQSEHMADRNYDDIGYNFLIDGFGNVYEGRGWDTKGSHAICCNSIAIGISYIGYFEDDLPTADALRAGRNLIACGVDMGKISSTYELNCHSDLGAASGDTDCPGTVLCDYAKANFVGL